MGPRSSSIGMKRISATWLVTAFLRKRREQVILNEQGRVLLAVTTWREERVRVVTAFEAIKRLIEFYYQERER